MICTRRRIESARNIHVHIWIQDVQICSCNLSQLDENLKEQLVGAAGGTSFFHSSSFYKSFEDLES
jgi:hypothetical protein